MATIVLCLFEAFFSGGQNQARERKAVARSIRPAVVETQAGFVEFEIPAFVKTVPPAHFAGISGPSNSIAEARRSAISDVVRQVLGSIGVEYEHTLANHFKRWYFHAKGAQRIVEATELAKKAL